jgi:hypothetical protein
MRVGAAEDDGGGGRLAGEVGARVVLVDAERLARRRHVLGPLPAVVVRVAVPHLRAHTRFIRVTNKSIIVHSLPRLILERRVNEWLHFSPQAASAVQVVRLQPQEATRPYAPPPSTRTARCAP